MAKEKTTEPSAAPAYVHVKFPPGFAHPYTFTDHSGKEWNKAVVNLPPGTKSNSVDLTGYSADVFLSSFQQSQIANGEPLSCSFREDSKVELFKGSGDERQTLSMDPWVLTKAVKAQRADYAVQKAVEREGQLKEDGAYSLSSEQRDVTAAKEKLAGQDSPTQNHAR